VYALRKPIEPPPTPETAGDPMRDDPPPPPEEEPYVEPAFDLRRGLRILLIVGLVVLVISVVCISLDSRYG
jgi:hypothetical protein